ncbi:MAG: hypothetical protein E6Q97_17985 [Desulfurellales bacterium]|nr:MAG: hypothetical protein E6Q97_17985 [Desulfurellales bacterium]
MAKYAQLEGKGQGREEVVLVLSQFEANVLGHCLQQLQLSTDNGWSGREAAALKTIRKAIKEVSTSMPTRPVGLPPKQVTTASPWHHPYKSNSS